MRPIIFPYSVLTGLKLHSYPKYLPTAYDEGMSLIQKTNKIIRHIEQIDDMSETLIQNWNQIVEWLTQDGILEMIQHQMNLWLADGTIAELTNGKTYSELLVENAEIIKENKEIKETLALMLIRVDKLEKRHPEIML